MERITSFSERDRISRNRIVSETCTNFFVEAGAGSGKTTMLVRRMVAMVEKGIDIRQICAITFTRAAAGEFYNRFQKALIERSSTGQALPESQEAGQLPPPTDETRERCTKALQNIDLCFMGTIDAFCGMLLSEHPSEAGIPTDAAIISDDQAESICRQQYVNICGGQYGNELQTLAKTFRTLHRDPVDAFVQGLSFVMNNRNVRFHYHEALDVQIDRDFAGERARLLRALRFLRDHPELKYGKDQKNLKAWEDLASSCQNLSRRWSRSFTSVLYGLKTLKPLRILPEAVRRYGEILEPVFVPGGKRGDWYELRAGQQGDQLDALKKLQYDASMTFIIRCIPLMEQAMREKGALTYFDTLYYLREMLRRDAAAGGKLIRYINARHKYFLIDEFQDTNPMQAEIFFYLASDDPVPQWSACVPRPGALFIVGDPKQSIYRFRSADVTSFLRVKKLFIQTGGDVLVLPRNFRSVSTLIEDFNQVFETLFPEEGENESAFEEIPVPVKKADEFQGIFTYRAYAEGKSAEEHPEATDPIRIAELIEKMIGNESFQLRGEHDERPRPLRYSDFMIITYGKRNLRPIMEELTARDIPTRVEGDVPFAENEALCEISKLYSAVVDPNNQAALFGALTGKLAALTYDEILRYKSSGCSVSLKTSADDDEGAGRVAEELGRLRQLRRQAQVLTPAALFARIMDEYRVYETLAADKLEVLFYALELLRNAERAGQSITLKDGGNFIKGLTVGESGEERCLRLEAGKDCVHLANLHKVKGMEAPVVILAAAAPSRNLSVAKRIQHGDHSAEGYLFSLRQKGEESWKSPPYFETNDYPLQRAAEEDALRAEEKRLLYVAATRARNALIVCNRIKLTRGKESMDSRWAPIAGEGLPDLAEALKNNASQAALREDKGAADASRLYAQAKESSALNDRGAEAAGFRMETPSGLHLVSKLEDPVVETVPPAIRSEQEQEKKRFPALLGTMTHKLMEMLVSTGGKIDAASAVNEIIREYRTAETEAFETELTATLTQVAGQIRSGGYIQANGLPQDILNTLLDADEVYCELPFCYKDEEQNLVWSGIMDVVYRENGRWHIVDYKTNADGSDLDNKYRGQLEAYSRALKSTAGLTADAHTYHIDI